MDCSKGRKTHRQVGMRQGASGLPDNLDPVQDCRRSRRDANLFNGLIAWPAQTGEDRISLMRRFMRRVSRFGSNLDTPGHLVREGRLFNVVLPGVSDGLVS